MTEKGALFAICFALVGWWRGIDGMEAVIILALSVWFGLWVTERNESD